MTDLIYFFSKVSSFIFNGFSHNKLYYFLPYKNLFLYKISSKDQKILDKYGFNYRRINNLKEIFILLNSIHNFLEKKLNIKRNGESGIKIFIRRSTPNNVLEKIEKIYIKYGGLNYFQYIIHGSYADNTFTAASDIDDVVFIKEKVYENYNYFLNTIKLLNKLNLFYQKIDFTQHHGHWIFTYLDKCFYNNYIIPVSVYKNATAIGQDIILYLAIDNHKNRDYCDILLTICDEIENETRKLVKNNKINLYELKVLVSGISLLPALAFQVKSIVLNKKGAIKRAGEIFSKESLKCIRWSTNLRKNWKDLKYYHFSKFIYKIISTCIKNRNLLDFLAKKSKIYLNRKDIPYFNQDVIKSIRNLINESKKLCSKL